MTLVQEKRESTETKRLAGKVALVTGGSRGIGAAIALRLAQDGAKVVISFAQNKNAADQIVERINKLGGTAIAVKANVSSESEARNLTEEITKSFGSIDILVNNAGVWESMPLEKIDLNHYQRLFDVNVKGVIATTTAALTKMQNGGCIINISSGAAKLSIQGASVYSATKAALETLTRIWAQELGNRKITVNAVAPGTTSTDMLNAGLSNDMKQMAITKTALGRLGEPEDIAAVVAFLASEDGRWVTGQTIGCDGGLII